MGNPSAFGSPLCVALISSLHSAPAIGGVKLWEVDAVNDVGTSMYQPSVSIRCFVWSHAPGIGCLSIVILTWRASRPNTCFRSPVSTTVVVTMTTPAGFDGVLAIAGTFDSDVAGPPSGTMT